VLRQAQHPRFDGRIGERSLSLSKRPCMGRCPSTGSATALRQAAPCGWVRQAVAELVEGTTVERFDREVASISKRRALSH
jgi:hypothetical protein